MPQPSINKIHLKIISLQFHSNFPGANELSDLTSHFDYFGMHPMLSYGWVFDVAMFSMESMVTCTHLRYTRDSSTPGICSVIKSDAMTNWCHFLPNSTYRQVSNIRRTLVGNTIVDHSDVVGESPVGAAPTTSSFSTSHLASLDCAKTIARRDEKHLSLGIWCILY